MDNCLTLVLNSQSTEIARSCVLCRDNDLIPRLTALCLVYNATHPQNFWPWKVVHDSERMPSLNSKPPAIRINVANFQALKTWLEV